MLCCMKAKLLLVLVVELSARAGVAAEQPAVTEPKWLTDASGCKFLSPSPRANATIEWDGKCVESFVGGPGEVRVGRVVYRGEFSRGRIVKGSIETGNGEVAEGEFLDNQLHGDAVIRAPGGVMKFRPPCLKGAGPRLDWPVADPTARLTCGPGLCTATGF